MSAPVYKLLTVYGLIAAVLTLPLHSFATEESQKTDDQNNGGESYTVYIENDTSRIGGPGSDSSYSSGLRFSYVYTQDVIPFWGPMLTDWSERLVYELKKSSTNYGISLAHQIFTPEDTSKVERITNDRPYAAWLYVGMTSSFQTASHSHSLEVDIGMVGPSALGREVQNNFHNVIGVDEAYGWDNQIDDEPTLQLSYQQRLRFYEFHRFDTKILDVIPYFGGALGNVLIAGNMGFIGRLGYNIPDDYGPTRPSSIDGDPVYIPRATKARQRFGVYAFGGLRGNAVAHNIFLDGSIFNNTSHHVSKYPFTAETDFGVGTHYDGWSFVWRFVTKTPEFKEKSEFNSFASISLSYSQDFD